MDAAGTANSRPGRGAHPRQRPSRAAAVIDVLVVLGLFLLARINDRVDHHGHDLGHQHQLIVIGFDLALVLPLLWRRRRPAEVFAVIAAVALVQWLSDTQVGGDFAILAGLYSLGAHEPRRRVLAAGVVIAELGVLMALLRWQPPASPHRWVSGILLSGTVTAAWVLGVYLRTRRAYLTSVLERAATAERERDQQALIAVASERARISREMHDIVAHSLSVMIALSDGAAAAISRDPEAARTTMGQASALGRQALGEVRRLLGDESVTGVGTGLGAGSGAGEPADLAPQPGLAQLDDLVAQVRSAGLPVQLVVTGPQPDLAPSAQLAVYRMIQEGLTNVLKHAHAPTRATVTLRYAGSGVEIMIENDDDPPRPTVSTGPTGQGAVGRGLAGMRERAAVFGGTVESGRSPDGGWRVVSRLSFEEDPAR